MTDSVGRPVTRFQMRLLALGLLASLFVLALAGRLVNLTVGMRDSLRERAELQYVHTLKLDPTRGTVRDRNGRDLATSVSVESVYGVPASFAAETVFDAAEKLSNCLTLSASSIVPRLSTDKRFVWLERKASPTAVSCVRELNLRGIGFLDETRRFYPKRGLAAHVLGYVGIDNEGMSGIEYTLEQRIRGESGRRLIWTDARNRRAGSRIETQPVPGRSVYLTIDENLQQIAESELERVAEESRAKSGIAVLMRPETGEILAMASFPGFNPNRYGDSPSGNWRNRSVTDVYEPGSTFKIITASAALAENVVSEDERVDCGNGSIVVGSHVIHDTGVHDFLSFREVVEKSSNVGMVRIGQRLGKKRFEDYVRAFGFGEASGIELPGESRGILRSSEHWTPLSQASISFGQEIGVTPLQMVTAANVLATGGYLMRPQLVLGFGDAGEVDDAVSPEPIRRVIDEKTARRMTQLLMGVVARGTGRRAQIEGYRVAGKTGTAQKAIRGGYSKTDYVASFVGFAPAEAPALTALVVLDSPEGDHSGGRAAAVFARIVERSLRYLEVPSMRQPTVHVAKFWPQAQPILQVSGVTTGRSAEPVNMRATMAAAPERAAPLARTPDVIGLSARDALARLVAAGVVPEIDGIGWVVEQEPKAGSRLERFGRARLVLGPFPPAARDRSMEESPPAPVAVEEPGGNVPEPVRGVPDKRNEPAN